jgi:hypothetical protein
MPVKTSRTKQNQVPQRFAEPMAPCIRAVADRAADRQPPAEAP